MGPATAGRQLYQRHHTRRQPSFAAPGEKVGSRSHQPDAPKLASLEMRRKPCRSGTLIVLHGPQGSHIGIILDPRAWVGHLAQGGFVGPDALVVALALPAAHGLVAPGVAAAPLVAALGSQAGLAESGQGWPAWLGSRLLAAVPGSQVETDESWEGRRASVYPALPPERPDCRVEWAELQGDWQDSI